MSTSTRTPRSRWLVGVAALVAAVVSILLVYTPADRLFTRTLQQGPLAIVVAFPASLLVGLGVALVVRRALRTPTWRSPAGWAVVAGGVAYLVVGGVAGVWLDVSNSPFADLVLTVGSGFASAVVVTVVTNRQLSSGDDGVPADGTRSLLAVGGAIAAGLAGSVLVLVGLTAALDPYIWPSVFVSGPVAIVAGIALAVVAYRRLAGTGGPPGATGSRS